MALELVTPTLIANTTMYKYINSNGVHSNYRITPNEGYVLHDQKRDWYEEFDDEGNPIGTPILGFTRGTASCEANYDFIANPREFYAVLATTVPADQIFGGGDNNNHEVM